MINQTVNKYSPSFFELAKKALGNDLNNCLRASSSSEILQLVLDERANSSDYSALTDRLAQFRSATEVHLIDFITNPTFRIANVFDLLAAELPNLQRISIVVENLAARHNLAAYETTIGDDARKIALQFIVPLSENIESRDHFSSVLNRELESDLRELQERKIPYRFLFALNPRNCRFADDMLLFSSSVGATDSLFVRSNGSSVADFNDSDRFHTAQFFSKLSKFSSSDLALSEYYRFRFEEFSSKNAKEMRESSVSTKRIDLNGEDADGLNYDLEFFPTLGVSHLARRGLKKIGGIVRHKVTSSRPTGSIPGTIAFPVATNPTDWKRVLITGWYGTETVGDKAILGEVLHFIKACSPNCSIALTTIIENVSLQTNRELKDLENVQLVDIKEAHRPACIEKVDAVIMGGGPLMESHSMLDIERIFDEANRQRKERIVFGCGIGPIHSEEIKEVATSILRMTTAGFVRDNESYLYAGRLFEGHVLKVACDPAVGFVSRLRNERSIATRNSTTDRIAGLVRANTNEFSPHESETSLLSSNVAIAAKVAAILERSCVSNNLKADLMHMNAPWAGGDDRIFNRLVEEAFSDSSLVRTERSYLTLEALVQSLDTAMVSVAMRYHGHIFCMALGIPFLSIDYTGQHGKVRSLLERINYDQWSENWQNIDARRAAQRLNTLIEERDYWSDYLISQSDRLVSTLNATYEEVFDVNLSVR